MDLDFKTADKFLSTHVHLIENVHTTVHEIQDPNELAFLRRSIERIFIPEARAKG